MADPNQETLDRLAELEARLAKYERTWGQWARATVTPYAAKFQVGSFVAGLLVMLLVTRGVAMLPALPSVLKWPISVVAPVSGPREIILAYESQNASPELKGALVSLRSGPVADRLKSKQHTLGIVDLDEKDKDGNPTPAVVAWKRQFPGLQNPAIVIRDASGKVLHGEVLPVAATSEQIDAVVRAHE